MTRLTTSTPPKPPSPTLAAAAASTTTKPSLLSQEVSKNSMTGAEVALPSPACP